MTDRSPAGELRSLRHDLLSGDLSSLEAHLAATEALANRLEAEGADPAEAAAIRAEAERNREIISAAAAGIRAALRRMAEAVGPAAVYSNDGRKHDLDPPRPTRETRA